MLHKTALLLINFILVFTLMGCTTYQVPPKIDSRIEQIKTESPIELTLWLWPGTGLEGLVQEYQKNHPNIKITIQTAQFTDVHNKLQTSFAAGIGAPDISAIEISFIERFKQFQDYFYNLGDYGAWDVREEFLNWKWGQALSSDGSFVYGLPTDIGPLAMLYQTEIFAQAGLPTEREEVAEKIATWDDLMAAGEQIRERTGKALFDNANNVYRSILSQAVIQYTDKQTGKLVADSNPYVRRAWDYAVHASEKNLTARLTSWVPEWGEGASSGQFAVLLAPAWMMGFMKSNAPGAAGKWDMTYLPEGSGNWGGSFLTLPKEGKHPEEAYKLIQWLTAPDQQLYNFHNNGNFPSTPDSYDNMLISEQYDEYFSMAPVSRIYAQSAKKVKPVYEGPHSFRIHLAIEEALQYIEKKGNTKDSEQMWNQVMDDIKLLVEPK